MDFLNLVKETRTIRRFKDSPLSQDTLDLLIDCARYSPCGANQQRLMFQILTNPQDKKKIFPLLSWAGALKDWEGPQVGERPSAYIVIHLNKDISQSAGVDHGIAAQSIALGARSKGLGCCMIGAFSKDVLSETLGLPPQIEPQLVLALGEPAEEIVIDDLEEGGSTTYFRDQENRHHVPKRTRKSLIWK